MNVSMLLFISFLVSYQRRRTFFISQIKFVASKKEKNPALVRLPVLETADQFCSGI